MQHLGIVGRHLQHTDPLESIYRKYMSRVRWVLRGRGIPESALDDLVHDVFLAIHRRLPARDTSLPLGTWIVGVTRNVAFSHRRALARSSAHERDAPSPQAWPAPDDALVRREAWASLDAFLGGLKPAQREAFVLVDVLGMPAVEVARSTGAETNTVYSRLRLARRKFQERFGELEAADTKKAFIERARKQGRPPADDRRRAWAAIAAELGTLSPLAPATPVLAKWGLGIAGAGLAAGVALAVLPNEPSPPVVPILAGTGSLPRPSPPPLAPQAVPRVAPPVSRPIELRGAAPPLARRPRAKVQDPSPPSDDVATQIERLRTIKAALNRGEPQKVLRMVDRFVVDYPKTALEIEARRLAREAACALGRPKRAEDAARHLRALGVAAPAELCKEKQSPS